MIRAKFIAPGFTLFLLVLIGLVLTVLPSARAQVSIPVTDVVVQQGGRQYFMHSVSSGHTYFSIANAYGVTVDDIRAANPQSPDVLRVNDALRIPVTSQNQHLLPADIPAQATGEEAGGVDALQITPERTRPSAIVDRQLRRTAPGSELGESELTNLEAMNLEHHLDQVITRALNNFFDPRYYLLHVSIDMSVRYYRQQLPVPLIRDQPVQFDEPLPGLPFVPPELRRNMGSVADVETGSFQMQQIRLPEIDRMQVVLWADTLFTRDELDLMQQVVEAKVAFDAGRGDNFEIIQQPFRAEPEPVLADAEPFFGPQFYLLLAGLVLFAILLGLLAWYILAVVPRPRKEESDEMSTMQLSANSLEFPFNDYGPKHFLLDAGSNGSGKGTADKNYLLQVVLYHPEQIGRLFTYWHENEGEHALMHAASILQSLDPKLLGMLRHGMNPEIYQKLEEHMRQPMIQSAEKREELLQRFARQLRMRQQQSGDKKEFAMLPSFDFLHYTEDDTLIEILKEESERIKALVLTHLPERRRGMLMAEFGLEEATRILFCLPQVRTMPFHEYERIASDLFNKSYYSGGVGESVTERDVDQIASVIESLPVSDQEIYIRKLGGMVSELADAVSERVITMERVPELDDDTLEEAVDAMSREDLATVLVDTDESLRTRILKFRPSREEEVIRDEIENQVFLSRDEIDEARAKFLDKLREIRNRKRARTQHQLPALSGKTEGPS